jgi:hypothetical protein
VSLQFEEILPRSLLADGKKRQRLLFLQDLVGTLYRTLVGMPDLF